MLRIGAQAAMSTSRAGGVLISTLMGKSSEWVTPLLDRPDKLGEGRKHYGRFTFERKKRTRTDGSKGICPETVNGRLLAASTLDTLSRKIYSSSKADWSLLDAILLEVTPDFAGDRSISKSVTLGAL
jgi:hypothetical protein